MPIVIDADARTDIPVSIRLEDYTVTTFDVGTEIAFSSATAVTCNLSAASTVGNGFTAVIRNIGAGTLTIDPFGTETVDGSTTVALAQDEWRWLRCDGTNWESVARSYDTSGGGRVQTYQFTDSTDITLTAAPTQSNIGSTQSVTIPTKGFITIRWSGRILLDASVTSDERALTFGVRISSTNYWPTINDNGTTNYPQAVYAGAISSSEYSEPAGGGTYLDIAAHNNVSFDVWLGIEELSIPTGSQTVQVIVAAGAAGSTIKGTTTTSRVYLETHDFS